MRGRIKPSVPTTFPSTCQAEQDTSPHRLIVDAQSVKEFSDRLFTVAGPAPSQDLAECQPLLL